MAFERLKFLMITTFFPPYNFGGDGIFIFRLSNMLAEEGHTVDVVHCVDAYHILEKTVPKNKPEHHPNVTVHSLRSKVGFLSPLVTQQTGQSGVKKKYIKDLIEKKQFDVINYHNMSLIGLDIIKLGNAIKIYTTHEHWLICPMHVLWKNNKDICEKRDCIKCQIVGKRPVQWWRLSNFLNNAMSHIDRIISPSLFTFKKHLEFGFDGPFVHIPNFLPSPKTDFDESEVLEIKREKPYFLYVGRLEKIKGPQTLISVFQNFKKADLVIAGDGSLENELKELAGNSTNIHFLGRVAFRVLSNLYKRATAVIVPSLCYEVFPLVILEAFAYKTPVIARHRGSLIEVVEKSIGGFNYNNNDELIHYMERLQEDKTLQMELGINGYKCYKENWTTKAYLKRYYELIANIEMEKMCQKKILK